MFQPIGFFHSTGGIVPLVSDIEIEHSDGAGPNNVSIIFNYRGTGSPGTANPRILTKRHDLTYILMGNDDASSPVDHTGEWTTGSLTGSPRGSLWEVACTSEDSGSWTHPETTVGTYVGLGVEREWRQNRSGGKGRLPGTTTVTATFRIREIADTSNFDDFQVICTNIQT